MSLACFECHQIGSFDTLVLFDPSGKFDKSRHVCEFNNYYVGCAEISDFTPIDESRFAIVRENESASGWNTGDDGSTLAEVQVVLVSETELEQKLPNTYRALAA